MAKSQVAEIRCINCGGRHTKHKVVKQHVKECGWEQEGVADSWENHQLIECAGCGSVKYRLMYEGWIAHESNGASEQADIYPDPEKEQRRRRPGTAADVLGDPAQKIVPATVFKMYRETLEAFNAGIPTLTTVGLRATVEAVCHDRGIKKSLKLVEKIDKLVEGGHLVQAHADFLHTVRDLGNDAAHEMQAPSNEDLKSVLEILEGLLNAIYILPSKHTELKARRGNPKNS